MSFWVQTRTSTVCVEGTNQLQLQRKEHKKQSLKREDCGLAVPDLSLNVLVKKQGSLMAFRHDCCLWVVACWSPLHAVHPHRRTSGVSRSLQEIQAAREGKQAEHALQITAGCSGSG